jgi:hypothetical protein
VLYIATGDQQMDQQTIIAIVIVCLTVSGFAAYFATILFGPNMKKYWDNRDGPGDA